MKDLKESDLYLPLKDYLESQGYEVKGEIQNCDVLAVRGREQPVIVELKLSLNLEVVMQAVDRLSLSPTVYVGVPVQLKRLTRDRKKVLKLMKMLGLGLIAINARTRKGGVQVLQDPCEFRPRVIKQKQVRLLGEFHKRVGDPNLGGADRRKGIMTAYRQRALAIANYLKDNGPTKAAVLARELHDPKARNVVYRDVYGWFERQGTGVYAITPRGRQEIEQW